MIAYLIKRLLLVIPTLLGVVTVCFLLTQIVPGGPVEQLISEMKARSENQEFRASQNEVNNFNAEQVAYLKAFYGLDKPIHIQYLNWLKRLFTFDFGTSYFYNQKISTLFIDRLPVSLTFGLMGLIIAYLLSIPLGIFKAIRHGSKFDTTSSVVILTAYAIPGFLIGLFLLVLLGGGSFFDLFPLRGLTSDNFSDLTFWQKIKDYLWHITLPLIAYSITGFATLTLTTKNLFLAEINQQYVITARAKGLSEKVILWKHIFKNAMILIISGIPASLAGILFAGNILIEQIFTLDGIGLLNLQAIQRRDYALVLTSIYFLSLIGLICGIISDILLTIIDPRITFNKRVA